MANIANITLAIVLAAQMAGAMIEPGGFAGVSMAAPIAMDNN